MSSAEISFSQRKACFFVCLPCPGCVYTHCSGRLPNTVHAALCQCRVCTLLALVGNGRECHQSDLWVSPNCSCWFWRASGQFLHPSISVGPVLPRDERTKRQWKSDSYVSFQLKFLNKGLFLAFSQGLLLALSQGLFLAFPQELLLTLSQGLFHGFSKRLLLVFLNGYFWNFLKGNFIHFLKGYFWHFCKGYFWHLLMGYCWYFSRTISCIF